MTTWSFGTTCVEAHGVRVSPHTLFLLGSLTKGLTATAALRLVERGQLELDRPIKDYVDWLAFSQPGMESRITIRMLLSHTAGLADIFRAYGNPDPATLATSIREDLPRYPFAFPPGVFPHYSGLHLNLLAFLMETVTETAWTSLMQELLFEPLEMKHTTFDPTIVMTHPLALGHHLDQQGQLQVLHRFPQNATFHPSALGISTGSDLAHFALMHVNQGMFQGRRLLTPETLRLMQTIPASSHYIPYGSSMGMGFMVEEYKGIQWFGNHGTVGDCWCKLRVAPQRGVGVILLMNAQQFEIFPLATYFHRFYDQLLDLPSLPAPTPVRGNAQLWPSYIGTSLYLEGGVVVISVQEEYLCLKLNDGPLIPLVALRDDLYVARSLSKNLLSVGFLSPESGRVPYLVLGGRAFTRIEVETASLDPTKWISYAGRYRRSAWESYHVSVEGMNLFFSSDGERRGGIPLNNTHFACEWGVFEFVVEEDGSVQQLIQIGYWIFTRQEETTPL
ncbi:hypothetical protein KSF_099040 [Reticulibacter mediterranei]|uniref:Beta-lactamase-related domain-containing protein n=1 Tax=Reticulibacter mediterranei TaxID=2778369 RepID=A0A8J3J1F7_9CHLR|nr:serine hydrolase domain-containing protein [Reticulibacter mediterranei]GHO99856.1 hypothetical protein KSF_099040 [Reticulibacter mediterranei]